MRNNVHMSHLFKVIVVWDHHLDSNNIVVLVMHKVLTLHCKISWYLVIVLYAIKMPSAQTELHGITTECIDI